MIQLLQTGMDRDDRGEYIHYFIEEQFWDGIFEPLFAIMPRSIFALFVGGMMLLSIYSYTESLTVPGIVLALFGGVIIMALPPAAATIATLVVVVVFALALWAIFNRG